MVNLSLRVVFKIFFNVETQKIDGTTPNTYRMLVVVLLLMDSAGNSLKKYS